MKNKRTTKSLIYTQSTLNIVGTIIGFIAWRPFPQYPILIWEFLTIFVGICTFISAKLARQNWTVRKSSIAFVINLLPIFPMLWLSNMDYVNAGFPGTPFHPNHLSALTVAVLAPPEIWAGFFGIFMFSGLAIIQIIYFLPHQLSAQPPQVMIVPTLAFGVFSLILYVFRLRGREREEVIARINERTTMSRELKKTLLSLQDLINSPIQTLHIDVKLLRADPKNREEVCKRIERSIEKLENLNEMVARQVQNIPLDNWNESLND